MWQISAQYKPKPIKHMQTKTQKTTKLFVITGGPGIGKTTLLDLLASKGHQVVPEAARVVIEAEQAIDGDALPWKNNQKFQEKVLELQLEYEGSFSEGSIFCDRGIVDGHGYCAFFGTTVPHKIHLFGPARYDKVFVLDQLPVYENDASRLEDAETARGIHQAVINAYRFFGYEPIFIPVLPPEERAEHLLSLV